MRHDRGLKHLKHLVLFLWARGGTRTPFYRSAASSPRGAAEVDMWVTATGEMN